MLQRIVITKESIEDLKNEVQIIAELINRFKCRIHLRKKNCSLKDIEEYCKSLSEITDMSYVTLHENAELVAKYKIGGYHAKAHELSTAYELLGSDVIYSQSCHSMEEVDNVDKRVEYVFLSPIFDSISKEGYKANFQRERLKEWLNSRKTATITYTKVIALGGITSDNLSVISELGFYGAALLGTIWGKNINNAIKNYEKL